MNNDSINVAKSTIKCKYKHENEMFIASDMTVWPCCFLWSEKTQNPKLIDERITKINGENWNSLRHHKLEEILDHPYYKTELEKSWDETHPQFIYRCITDCGNNRAAENIMIEAEDKTNNE